MSGIADCCYMLSELWLLLCPLRQVKASGSSDSARTKACVVSVQNPAQ